MLIKLHESQLHDLTKFIPEAISESIINQITHTSWNKVHVEVTEQLANDILDELTKHLMSHGMDDPGELNQVGYGIESLIDIFNFEYE